MSFRRCVMSPTPFFVALTACLAEPVFGAAALMTVQSHTLTDENADPLLAGDQVMVTTVVANVGDATATATLLDSLTNLQQPVAVTVNGFVCSTCSSTANSLTVQLSVAQGAADVVQFTTTVPSLQIGAQASSSVVVAFSPADPGTSPTSADVASLLLDSIFRNGFEQ
jgi:hypothetical protein